MKKLVSLLLALLVCFAAMGAYAETIEVADMLLDHGLCTVTPAQWQLEDLTEEELAEGYLLMNIEQETGRCMLITMQEIDPATTNAELADTMNDDPDILTAQLVSNEHDTEVILYALKDETLVGYRLLDGEGHMYDFIFLQTKGERISGDDALLALVDTCIAETYIDEALALYADDEDYPTAQPADDQFVGNSGVVLEMVAIEDGPSFPIPVEWKETELSDEDIQNGCVAGYNDEDGHLMLIMASKVGKIDTTELADVLAADDDYIGVRLMSNDRGHKMVLFVTNDQTTGGYCFMDDEGWMYQFLFGMADGSVMTGDEALAQLVQDCMDHTYFE